MKGTLSRWLIEPKSGVFVGNISAAVRERIWKKVCGELPDINALLIFSDKNELGFTMDSVGNPSKQIIDFEGIQLIKTL